MTEAERLLRAEIEKLCYQGKDAAVAGDLDLCVELGRKVQPLLRQLAELSGDDEFEELADEGEELCRKTEGREWHVSR